MKSTKHFIFVSIIALIPVYLEAATVCREIRIEGYEDNEKRAAIYVPQNKTSSNKGLSVYIERDKYGNPYYHSNYVSKDTTANQLYEYPTKIGGKSEPAQDFDTAFAQIIHDNVTGDNLGAKVLSLTKSEFYKNSNIFINKNVFLNGISLISSEHLKKITLVDPYDPKHRVVIEQSKKEPEGGRAECETLISCLDDSGELSKCNSSQGFPKRIMDGVKQFLCKT